MGGPRRRSLRQPDRASHRATRRIPSAGSRSGIAVAVIIPTRGGRVAAIAVGAVLTIAIGLSRIYLRAHFASDVLAGEALASTVYALTALVFGRRIIRIG